MQEYFINNQLEYETNKLVGFDYSFQNLVLKTNCFVNFGDDQGTLFGFQVVAPDKLLFPPKYVISNVWFRYLKEQENPILTYELSDWEIKISGEKQNFNNNENRKLIKYVIKKDLIKNIIDDLTKDQITPMRKKFDELKTKLNLQ